MMLITIAQIKAVPEKGDMEKNYSKLIELLSTNQLGQVDVIVTPECFLDGYVCTEEYVTPENIKNYAIDPIESKYIQNLSDWINKNRVWMIFGCMRKDNLGCYNTALVINRKGKLIGWYDKVQCQTHDKKYNAGNSLPVFDSDFGKFGLMICADRRWPETARTLAFKGAQIIFNPTYGFHNELNLCMMRTRSFENEIFIVFTHPQQSLITAPTGEIICDNRISNQEIVISQIDLSEVENVRSGNSAHLRDRRPDIYEN